MVKSKSAGYICPSLKEKKVHRFSLSDESFADDGGTSLLAVDCNNGKGKLKVLDRIFRKSREFGLSHFCIYRELSEEEKNEIQAKSGRHRKQRCGAGQKEFLSVPCSLCNLQSRILDILYIALLILLHSFKPLN